MLSTFLKRLPSPVGSDRSHAPKGHAHRVVVAVYGSPPICKKKRQSRLTLLQRIRLVCGRSSPQPQWEPLGCVPYKTIRLFDLLPPPGLASGRSRSSIYWNHQAAHPIRCTAPSHSPRKSFSRSPQAAFGWKDVFRVRTAQMIRATLLALATTILLVCMPRSTSRSMNTVTPFSRFLRL